MEKMEVSMKVSMENKCKSSPPPPPPLLPPLPQPRAWNTRPEKVCRSVTREEIAKFWRQKKMEEEDHLLAAIKAAARIRARNLTVRGFPNFIRVVIFIFLFQLIASLIIVSHLINNTRIEG